MVQNGTHQLIAREDSSHLATLADDQVATFVMDGNIGNWSSKDAVTKLVNFVTLLRFGDAVLGDSDTEILIEWGRFKNRLFKDHWKHLIVPLVELIRSEWAIILREINYLNYVF